MKTYVALILGLFLGALANAQTQKNLSDCVISEFHDGAVFDEGFSDTDEDYAVLSLNQKGNKYSIKMGGFTFPQSKADKIVVTKDITGITAKIKSKTFGNIIFNRSYVDGKATVKTKQGLLIADLICDDGLNIKLPEFHCEYCY